MVQKLVGEFTQIKDLSPTVKQFTIDVEEEFNFIAGQFVNISFEHEGETLRKPYSIASKPDGSSQFELCIKLVEDGKVTPKLWEMNQGDSLDVMGPLGLFKVKGEKEKIVFIATGTGISPLRSMIHELLENNSEKQLHLIFGVRKENEVLYKEEFEELEQNHPNFKFTPIVSRPENWEGRTGHVQDNFDGVDPLNSEVYMCGLQLMIDSAKEKLLAMGMNEEDIHFEKYI